MRIKSYYLIVIFELILIVFLIAALIGAKTGHSFGALDIVQFILMPIPYLGILGIGYAIFTAWKKNFIPAIIILLVSLVFITPVPLITFSKNIATLFLSSNHSTLEGGRGQVPEIISPLNGESLSSYPIHIKGKTHPGYQVAVYARQSPWDLKCKTAHEIWDAGGGSDVNGNFDFILLDGGYAQENTIVVASYDTNSEYQFSDECFDDQVMTKPITVTYKGAIPKESHTFRLILGGAALDF